MYKILSSDKETKARTGLLKTPHGDIPTPVFMPVGTGGTVKGILQRDLSGDIDARIILGNTYHLYLMGAADTHRQRRLPGIFAFREQET
jgi:queuine tRNA-ribosyltransferase